MSYDFGKNENLNSRTDHLMHQNETLVPDDMNRLKEWKINNSITHSIVYDDKLGNITSKSDIGYEMNYGANGQPHALTSISGNPSIIPDDEQTITYTDFNKIATITEGTNSLKLSYGVNQ